MTGGAVPVIALTGHLGAGKTTLLNHLLRQPDSRIGVVINDFGEINVDAQWVSGQIGEPASIAGGCLCCLTDSAGLDDALGKLSAPRFDLDAIVVEASGIADPLALDRLLRFSTVKRIRPAGVIDVVDAVEHFRTVDVGALPPARYAVTGLVVVNKIDLIPEPDRKALLDKITDRVRHRNPAAQVVAVRQGRIDPALLYDISPRREESGQLSLQSLLAAEPVDHTGHRHADSVTVTTTGPVDPARLLQLLDDLPAGAYRIKGTVTVLHPGSPRGYLINVVGERVHLARTAQVAQNQLVAIGVDLDREMIRARLSGALQEGATDAEALRRLRRMVRAG